MYDIIFSQLCTRDLKFDMKMKGACLLSYVFLGVSWSPMDGFAWANKNTKTRRKKKFLGAGWFIPVGAETVLLRFGSCLGLHLLWLCFSVTRHFDICLSLSVINWRTKAIWKIKNVLIFFNITCKLCSIYFMSFSYFIDGRIIQHKVMWFW